jgi:predicted small metal-binding protein
MQAVRKRGTRRGKWKEDEVVRELHCMCGNRVVGDNDEDLVQQVLEHAREVHPEMNLTEEQAREMVASGASDREDTSS